jgi:hypothetical protein
MVGGDYPVKARQVHPGAGHQGAQAAITHAEGPSYLITGLALLLALMWINVWRMANKEYREGRLTGAPLERERA